MATLQIKKAHAEYALQITRERLQDLASREEVIRGMREIKEAFRVQSALDQHENPERLRNRAQAYFETSFVPEYRRRNQDRLPANHYITLLDANALLWHELFVWPSGASLDRNFSARDKQATPYARVHSRHHDFFANISKRLDFHDLVLVDDASGDVVFSIRKEIDFGTSLIQGPFANTGMGEAFRRVRSMKQENSLIMIDYAAYFPSHDDLYAFMAVSIPAEGQRQGVMIAQFHGESMDRIVQDRMGIGQTEDIFLLSRAEQRVTYRSTRSGNMGMIGDIVNDLVPELLMAQDRVGVRQESDAKPVFATSGSTLQVMIPLDIPGVDWHMAGIISLEEAMDAANVLNHLLLGILLAMILFVSLAALVFGKSLLQPMRALAQAAQRIATGHGSARVVVETDDEIGQMGLAFNHMARRVEQQYWVKEELATLAGVLQAARSVPELSQVMVRQLLALLNAAQGAFYLRDKQTGRWMASAGYQFESSPEEPISHAPGEGIVGRCLLERQTIVLDNLSSMDLKIDTGVGQATPVSVVALPLNYHEQTLGVIVLAACQPFTPEQRQLLDEFSLLGALSLDNLERIQHIEELLAETRVQAVELESSQQELEQMNQELETNLRALRHSEEEMRLQQEELARANQGLEEQAQLLEQRNEQIERARLEVEKSSRYKSEFLANMSHELRTPLNSILILSREFVKNSDGRLAVDQVEAAQVIRQSGMELLDMIDEILDISRIEAGRVDLQIETMDPGGFAEEIRRQFAPLAREKSLGWHVTTDPSLPSALRLDQTKLRRIVKNLLVNAFKFTTQGEISVVFGWQPADHQTTGATHTLAIRVADTGVGISRQDQAIVFEAFRQIHHADGSKQSGVGLGLAIAQKLARLMGGSITLESEPGQGSVFTLLVPGIPDGPDTTLRQDSLPVPDGQVVSAPPAPVSVPDPVSRLPDGRKVPDMPEPVSDPRSLLIIEDDPIFAGSVATLAEGRGFRVLTAGTGQDGLALAVREQPKGIILDLGLPDISGEELLVRLQEHDRTRHIPVHIISARADPGEKRRLGALGYLVKPAPDAAILQVLQRLNAGVVPSTASRDAGSVLSSSGLNAGATPASLDMGAGAAPLSPGRRRLLLVEDQPEMRQAVIALVEDQNVEVVEAATGTEALAHLAKSPFDCLILDLGLPDMDGLQLLEQMRSLVSGVLPPVVIHSARDLTRAEHDRLQQYSDSIIVKGVHAEERLRNEVILFLHRVEQDTPGKAVDVAPSMRHHEEFFAGKTVLLVDDDVRNVFSMTRTLEKNGLQVRMAGNGREALAVLERDQPVDIILMDMMMPVMDGYAAMREIRTRAAFSTLPILALTAKAMPEDRRKCLDAGANDYLAKPVDMDRLLAMMRIWMGKKM
ncbi:MAG: response regulator [Magnetococcus sp. DMHC-1]